MDRIKNLVRYYPNDIFIDKVNLIIDVKNGDSTANVSKLKKSNFINNKSNSVIVPAINKLIDGEDVKINTDHLAKNIDKVIVSKINEAAKAKPLVTVTSVSGFDIPYRENLFIDHYSEFKIKIDNNDYECISDDFNCNTDGVDLTFEKRATENILIVTLDNSIVPNTKCEIFFKSLKIIDSVCVEKHHVPEPD